MRRRLWVADAQSNGPDSVDARGEERCSGDDLSIIESST
jgi:hypothetical protein